MAQNVTIAGASYPSVPSITVPKTGGGTASFLDTQISSNAAGAASILSGKKAYVNGSLVEGTCTFDANTSAANATSEDILNGKIAFVKGDQIFGSYIPTNLSILHINLGNTSNSNELRTASFEVYGRVNSLIMLAWGYQSSTQANSRRVIKIVHIPEAATFADTDRYKFLCANGGASTSSGYNMAEGYIAGFNGVTYTYNASTDRTTIDITLPNSNMSGYAGKPRFSSHYHVIAFYVSAGCGNVEMNAYSGASAQSVGGNAQLMGGNPGGSDRLDLMGFGGLDLTGLGDLDTSSVGDNDEIGVVEPETSDM